MSFLTPILFLVFNRPEQTAQVFERIRAIKPKFLYVAADGPRLDKNNDKQLCELTRTIATDINWDCELTTLFRDSNFGCKNAVSSGIEWFFDNVEEGIILEDDVLPDLSFFNFSSKLLEIYRHHDRVMMISGHNNYETWKNGYQDYHFSNFGSIWGWASWKRAWDHYDINIEFWANESQQDYLLNNYFPSNHKNVRRELYNDLYNNKIDTWDYQWTLSRLIKEGVTIVPSKNLTRNIGFDFNATHTISKPAWLIEKIYSLRLRSLEPKSIEVDSKYDQLLLDHEVKPKNTLINYLKSCAKNFLNK